MKRTKLAAGVGVVAFGIICCMLYGYVQEPAIAGADYASWDPVPAAIRMKIGTVKSPARGLTATARQDEFCTMFKSRFRRHEPPIAIGLHFVNPRRIKLMCPARMEPFLIDRVALAAWREAKEDFGEPIEIDIYDTFIGTSQIKIGELRAVDKLPGVAHISYDFAELQDMNRPRHARPRVDAAFRRLYYRDLAPFLVHPSGQPAL